jgi:hypothetical protein
MALTLPSGAVPFGVYAVIQNFNIPIQVQPQIFMALCLIAWVQILIYNKYARERNLFRLSSMLIR